ncbi:Hypothetical protein, putative [Bodo saltans]|uniref:Uncharacterized protein n=1 Tax=Bodo saltans TaxID=75058 RepID=A0A0S4JHP2_BODSA|nr:Hypothetical protein, putative [Bodo saltans]|eukprot:CUG89890.1 Hypothetical protein, putative [Bodo saltans]
MVALGDNLAASGLGSQQPSICSAAPFFALMTPPAAHNASLDSSSWSEDTTEMWLRAVFSVVSLERRGNGTAVIPASRVAANVRQGGSSLHNSTTVFRTALVRDGLANAVACCFSLTADAVRYFSDIVVVLFSENSNATDSMHALVRLYGSQVNIRNAFYRCLTHGLLRLHEMSMKMENGLLELQQPTTCRSQEELDDTFVSWCTSVTCIVNAADQLEEKVATVQEVLSPRVVFFTSELVELFNRMLPFLSSVRGGLFHWCQLLCSLTSPPASVYDDDSADGGGLRMLSSSTDPLLLCDALLTTALRLLQADKSWRRPPDRRSWHAVETLHDTPDDSDEDFEGVFSTITSALNVVLPAVNGTHNAERIILCRELLSVLCDVAASSSFHVGLPTSSLHVSRCIITAAVKSHVIAMLGEVAATSSPQEDNDFLLSFLRMIHSRVYMALLSISAATRGGGMLPNNNGNCSPLLYDKVSSCVPWICGALSNLLDVRDNASRMLNILFHGWYVVLSVDHLGSSIMSHDVRVAQQPASTVFCDDRDTSKLRDEHADDTERQVYSPRLCGSLLSEVLLGLSTACEGSNATRWFFSMLSKLSTPLLQDDHAAKNDIDVVVLQASVEAFTHRKLHQEVCRLLTTQVLGPEAIISACRWVTVLCNMFPMTTTAHAQQIFSAKMLHSVCACAKQIITHVDCAVAVLDAIDALLSASAKYQQPVVETDDAEEGFARVTHEVQSTVLALQSLCSSPRSREALRRALCALCLTADGTAIMFDSEASVSLFRDAMLRTFAIGDVRDSESDMMMPADLFATCRAFAALANHCPYDTLLQDERLGLLWIRLCQRLASNVDDLRHNAAHQPPVITSPASSSPSTASTPPVIPQDEAACSLMQCLEALCRRSLYLTAFMLGGGQHRVEPAARCTSGEGGDRDVLSLSEGSDALYHVLLWLFPWMSSPTSAAACRAIEAAAFEPSARLCLSALRFVGLLTKVLAPVAATATGSDTSPCVAWACAVNRITLQTSASFPEPKIAATSVVSASPLRKPSAAKVERHGGEDQDDDVIRSRFATREMHDAIMLLSTPLCCYSEDASSVMWKCSVLIHLTATDEHVSVFWTEALRNWIVVHAIPTVGNALSAAAALASTSSRSDPKSTGQLTKDPLPPASSPTTRWALTKTFSKEQLVGMSKSFREAGLPIEIEPARWLCGAIANLTLREEGRRLYLSSYPNVFLQLLPLASAVPMSSEATRWMLAVLCNLTSWSPITSKNLNANDNHHSSHHSPSSSSNSMVDTLQIVVPTMLRLCATAIVDEGGVRLLCVAYRQVFATIESLGGGTTSSSSNVSTHFHKPALRVGPLITDTADPTGNTSSTTTPEFDVVALSRMVPMIDTPTVASDLFLAFLALPMPLLSTRRCRVLRVADTVTTTTTSLALSRSSSGSSSEFVPVATKAAQRNTTTSQAAMVVAATNDEGCIVLDGSDLVADAIIDLSMLSAKWDTAAYHLAKLALRIMTADPLPKKHTRHALRRALAAIISVVGESRSTINVDDKTTDALQNAFSVVSSDKIV